MCVIVVKCKGSDFAPAEAIERCIQTNPHGFAIAWNEGGHVKTFKTMNPSEAMAKYMELTATLDPRETAMLFHARIATHGSHRVENCHCWVHHGPHGDICFAHNGVLTNIPAMDDMTDSETFFRDYFVPALDNVDKDDPEMTFSLRMSRAIIGDANSKFAFLDGNGRIWMSSGRNPYVKKQFPGLRGKIYFSNDNWMPRNTFWGDFNPYSNVPKKSSTKASGSSLGSAKRNYPAPKEPLAVVNMSMDQLELAYQSILDK